MKGRGYGRFFPGDQGSKRLTFVQFALLKKTIALTLLNQFFNAFKSLL